MAKKNTKPIVFISYSHPTTTSPTIGFVSHLTRYLLAEGIEVCSDQSLIGGDDWEKELPKWRREADALIFVYSQESARPESWCHNEIASALDRDQPIIPLRFDDTWPLPDSIRSRDAIDFRQGIKTDAVDELIKSINVIFNRKNQKTGLSEDAPLPHGNLSLQMLLAFIFGVAFLVVLLVVAVLIPNPTPFAYTVFRIVLALAAAGVAAVLPGFISLKMSPSALIAIRAGGALAVFIIIYFFSPALIAQQSSGLAPTPTSAPSQSPQSISTGGCTVAVFTVTPSGTQQPSGTKLVIRGTGSCQSTIRAAKITAQVDNQEEQSMSEMGGDGAKSRSADWTLQKGNNKLCFKITDVTAWEDGAQKCETIVGL